MNKTFLFAGCLIIFCSVFAQQKNNFCNVNFENIANGKKIVIKEVDYKNNFEEPYTVTKLKYYVSNIHFVYTNKKKFKNSIYLMDASKENGINMPLPSADVKGISFLLGVDSLQNCSGAQSGALDPLNEMFWTWNNGYIVFKLEGKSASSTADNNRIEQHIGGYKGSYKTMREIFLPLDFNFIKTNTNITIQLNLDKYWDGINKINIAKMPVIASPGMLAKNAADNFEGMFSIKK